jgi:hypothetical protein
MVLAIPETPLEIVNPTNAYFGEGLSATIDC